MILKLYNYVLDADIEATTDYYKNLSLCECAACRNFYAQAKTAFPLLTDFLSKTGIDISRPDEICGLFDPAEDKMDYHMVAYTVVGKIITSGKNEIDIWDNDLFLSITIDDTYVPNEQRAEAYFTVMVYGIRLPWVLDEPYPEEPPKRNRMGWVKKLFGKNHI